MLASAKEQILPLHENHNAMAAPELATCEDETQAYETIAALVNEVEAGQGNVKCPVLGFTNVMQPQTRLLLVRVPWRNSMALTTNFILSAYRMPHHGLGHGFEINLHFNHGHLPEKVDYFGFEHFRGMGKL